MVEVLKKRHSMLVYMLVRRLLRMFQDMLGVVVEVLLVDG